jgi:eight-cysteine-cluster-containing protein
MKRLMILIVVCLFLVGFAVTITGSTITTGAIKNNSLDLSSNQDSQSDNPAVTATNTNQEGTRVVTAAQAFCGTSTFGACESDSDCITSGCSNSLCQSKSEEQKATTCEYRDCYNAETYNVNCLCIKNRCMWSKLTEAQIQKIITERNRIMVTAKTSECPAECTCTGSTVKCQLSNEREMTIVAGNSGNVIVQVKGQNMTTNVTLYKSDGKVYGVFKNNETKVVRMLPDQVRERIRERVKTKLYNENMTLNENGEYEYEAEKEARLFFIFPVRIKMTAEVSAETGEVLRVREKAWWAFLTKDVEEEPLLGASCGTVTPGSNDACCQTKGYDFWDSETEQCEFSE